MMIHFIFRRLCLFLLMLLIASGVIFFVLEILPGNAAQILAGAEAPPETVQHLTTELGLDRSGLNRYWNWIYGIFTGDLGVSYIYGQSVFGLIAERLSVTLPLACMAMLLTLGSAIPLGLYAAMHQNTKKDYIITTLSFLGLAIPSFWFALILIFIFTVQLQWFNYGGFPGWTDQSGSCLWQAMHSLLLPAIAMALAQAAVLFRVTRTSVSEKQYAEFVRAVRSKGLTRRSTFYKHILRNALPPILTIAGLQFANLLIGAIVIENVFSLPGLGRLVFQSVANRDLIVVRNILLFLVVLIMLVNLLVDLLCAYIDPRMTQQR